MIQVDATNLKCPMPLLKTKLALADIDTGQYLIVLASDQGSLSDIPKYLARAGHKLVKQEKNGDVYRFEIQKS